MRPSFPSSLNPANVYENPLSDESKKVWSIRESIVIDDDKANLPALLERLGRQKRESKERTKQRRLLPSSRRASCRLCSAQMLFSTYLSAQKADTISATTTMILSGSFITDTDRIVKAILYLSTLTATYMEVVSMKFNIG